MARPTGRTREAQPNEDEAERNTRWAEDEAVPVESREL
jgi:hypothetical protein